MTSPSQETPAEAQCAVQAVPAGSLAVLATLTAGELREAEERIYAPLVIPPEPRWLPGWPEYDACRPMFAADDDVLASRAPWLTATETAMYEGTRGEPGWLTWTAPDPRDRPAPPPESEPQLPGVPRFTAAPAPEPAPEPVTHAEPEPRTGRWRHRKGSVPEHPETLVHPSAWQPHRQSARHQRASDDAADRAEHRSRQALLDAGADPADLEALTRPDATAQMTQYLAAPGAAEGERDQ